MRAPLTVAIADGVSRRMVTRYTSGLRFRKTAPGGHADASCKLNIPADTFTDLGPADRMWIYDGRTGAIIFDGYTSNPGTQTGDAGEGFDLSALGGASLASDRRERLIYIDQSMDWSQDTLNAQAPSATGQAGTFPEGIGGWAGFPCAYVQFNPGQPITTSSQAGVRYSKFEGSAMVLGGFGGVNDAGRTDANFSVQWIGHGTSSTINTRSMSAAAIYLTRFRDTDFAGRDYTSLTFRLSRVAGGATNVSTDDIWTGFGIPIVLGQLKDRYGADRAMSTTAHFTFPTAYILASEVVEDMLGRVLTFCDPAASVIETTATQIDQLAYTDAVAGGSVLDDLLQSEGGFLWEILESNMAGRHRFNWRAWPTEHRYVIPSSTPVEQPGGDVDLCNRVVVNWVDSKGKPQVSVFGAYVPELGNKSPIAAGALDPTFVGRIRDADPVTLPEGRGSLTNAVQIGTQILAAKATPPRAAKADIDAPIMDRLRGAMVQPWEIEPGYLARIVATGQDLRLTEVEYADESGAASLTLGDPVLSEGQRIARLGRVR